MTVINHYITVQKKREKRGGINHSQSKQTQPQKFQMTGRESVVWDATFGPPLHRHQTHRCQTAVEREHCMPPRHAHESLAQFAVK